MNVILSIRRSDHENKELFTAMKTKTTITVEKWEYTAVRLKREPVKTDCGVCGEEEMLLSAPEPPVREATEDSIGEERRIGLRPLDQQ